MRPYHVAIVGSGPSGYFAAASLLKFADVGPTTADVRVDMLEMLPTPWGLVRSGVAPDHPKIKSISAQFEKTATIRGSGSSATSWSASTCRPAELAERYDAVIYAVGAQSDRPLGIPGEDLPGSVAAVDFVGWYNAHPHFEEMAPDLSSGRAVVVGNGNVALDVARILVTDPDVLADDRHRRPRAGVAARPRRRGGGGHRPARAAAGPVHHAGAARTRRPRGDRRRRRDRRSRRLRRHHRRGSRGGGQDRQAEHQGAARLRRTRADAAPSAASCSGSARRRSRSRARAASSRSCWAATSWSDDGGRVVAKDTGEREELPAQLVVRAVGYRGVPTPGLPFDDAVGTIPHTDGRIEGSRNEYVVGWIKRGPSGVIGSNKKDSQETVDTLLADLSRRGPGGCRRGRFRRARRMAAVAPAQAGDRRPLEADRRPRTGRR